MITFVGLGYNILKFSFFQRTLVKIRVLQPEDVAKNILQAIATEINDAAKLIEVRKNIDDRGFQKVIVQNMPQ
jgi:hypothetical protein